MRSACTRQDRQQVAAECAPRPVGAKAAPIADQGFALQRHHPIRTETWKAGVYVFAVAVARGADQGHGLTTVLMD